MAWFPAPLSSAVVASNIRVLQNVFVIIIGTEGLVLVGYRLRRSGFVRWPGDCGVQETWFGPNPCPLP